MTKRLRDLALPLGLFALAAVAMSAPALAQAHNPFSVGISEGGGGTTGFTGWLLSQQGVFERSISAAVRASTTSDSALWLLMGLSFLYGVLHAAGPGHGKAVLASYMVANEKALRRGIALSFLAALLQAGVAIGLVSILSLVFHVTAVGMRNGAAIIEKASYVGIALLGAWLVWRKGRAFLAEWRGRHAVVPLAFSAPRPDRSDTVMAFAGAASGASRSGYKVRSVGTSAFVCDAAHEHGPDCGHYHAPDPTTLGEGFSWRESISTVIAAGARPCSGAILVLVFALFQGFYVAGILSALVMALGTAITTAALASTAVLAKSIALRLTGARSRRGLIAARGLELAAAALVLAVGLSLLLGVGPLQALS